MSVEIITQILMGGGVIYLIIDKLLLSKKEKVDVKHDILGNGTQMIDIYKEIDVIVASKTKPLEDKIDQLTEKLDKFGCYREGCEMRLNKPEEEMV